MSLTRAAEALFNFPRLYRAKFAVTGAALALVRPVLFRTLVTVEDVIRAAAIPPGASVCEIGCGDGENYRLITAVVGAVRYSGIDINPKMVEHCAGAYPEQRWLCGTPPYDFADKEFDFCVIVNVLHHLNSERDMEDMLAESGRISKAVVLFEPLQSENRVLYALKRAYWSLTDGGFRYLRLNEFHALFAAAGMRPRWQRYSSPLRHFFGAHLVRDSAGE
jgi:SAM-dependent methyltransferase